MASATEKKQIDPQKRQKHQNKYPIRKRSKHYENNKNFNSIDRIPDPRRCGKVESQPQGRKGVNGMFGVNRQTLERLRKEYPAGTRVELIRLDDPYRKIPSGTTGTVEYVDDAGQLHTVWDGHGSLAMIYGVDEWRKI